MLLCRPTESQGNGRIEIADKIQFDDSNKINDVILLDIFLCPKLEKLSRIFLSQSRLTTLDPLFKNILFKIRGKIS